MIGLLYKEFLIIRSQSKIYLALLVVYGLLGMYTRNSGFLVAMIAMYSLIINLNIFSYDEKNKWMTYALTLPANRSELVKIKYIFSSILTVFMGILILFVQMFISSSTPFAQQALTILVTVLITLVLYALLYPFIFELGVEMARIMMIIVFVLFMLFFIGTLSSMTLSMDLLQLPDPLILIGAILITLCLYIGSMFLSIHIVSKKDYNA